MKLISSRMTFFHKKILPLFWVGFLAFFVVKTFSGAGKGSIASLIFPCVIAAIGFLFLKKLVWNLADKVYDCGDALLFKKGAHEERIMLSNIMNVSSTMLINPPRITLRLIQAGSLGPEVCFSPTVGFL